MSIEMHHIATCDRCRCEERSHPQSGPMDWWPEGWTSVTVRPAGLGDVESLTTLCSGCSADLRVTLAVLAVPTGREP